MTAVWDPATNQYLGSGGGGVDPQTAINTSAVNSAQADLDVAEASLAQAELNIAAIDADNATQTELDAAVQARETAQAAVDAAQDVIIALNTAKRHDDDDVETVTGTAVNVTDPRNPVIDILADMGGADGTNAGSAGKVPAPTAPDDTKFLKGDGTWSDVPDMEGADGTLAGKAGLVPAQAAADNTKFLRGDGTFQPVSSSATRIDASGGAVVETLTASADAGTVIPFINIDLTNSATLAVQAGETLNGVVDGAFLFSNYPAGTQFRADEVTGGWVVSVVGASVDGESSSYPMDLTDITATNTTLSLGTNAPNSGTVLYNDGTATITRIGDKAFCTLRIETDDDDAITLTMGSSIVPVGGKILQASVNGFHRWENSSQTVVSSGNTITLNRSTAVDADLETELFFITDGWTEVNQQVLAGMVVPTALHSAYWQLQAANIDFTTGGQVFTSNTAVDYATGELLDLGLGSVVFDENALFDVANDKIVINKAGRYRIDFDAIAEDGGGNSTYALMALGDGTNILAHFADDAGDSRITHPAGHHIADFAAGDELDIRLYQTNGENFQVRAANWSITEQPTSTVVMPDALDVEAMEIVLDTQSIANGGTLTIPADLSDYEYIRFEVEDAGDNNVSVEGRVKASAISSARIALHHDDASGYVYFDTDITGTTATLTGTIGTLGGNGFSLAMTARVIGVKEQKTVINTVDMPVNDQASSGYMDFGAMRMQWGQATATNPNSAVTLPAPFSNSTYSVVASSRGGSWNRNIGIISQTATTFNPIAKDMNDVSTTAAIHWQAIGLKP